MTWICCFYLTGIYFTFLFQFWEKPASEALRNELYLCAVYVLIELPVQVGMYKSIPEIQILWWLSMLEVGLQLTINLQIIFSINCFFHKIKKEKWKISITVSWIQKYWVYYQIRQSHFKTFLLEKWFKWLIHYQNICRFWLIFHQSTNLLTNGFRSNHECMIYTELT